MYRIVKSKSEYRKDALGKLADLTHSLFACPPGWADLWDPAGDLMSIGFKAAGPDSFTHLTDMVTEAEKNWNASREAETAFMWGGFAATPPNSDQSPLNNKLRSSQIKETLKILTDRADHRDAMLWRHEMLNACALTVAHTSSPGFSVGYDNIHKTLCVVSDHGDFEDQHLISFISQCEMDARKDRFNPFKDTCSLPADIRMSRDFDNGLTLDAFAHEGGRGGTCRLRVQVIPERRLKHMPQKPSVFLMADLKSNEGM